MATPTDNVDHLKHWLLNSARFFISCVPTREIQFRAGLVEEVHIRAIVCYDQQKEITTTYLKKKPEGGGPQK